ncbi:hypothetical protein PanWU01x14_057240 [Parasponia andersonii]|uniref:Uncharacterized protein n=1 Tax=Parasponia andersonii TaxID=3476 RepID=A0A2P5DJR5_PARAD|nr:hypothetical protein PanWU01x14_057240 [Parasponia andersonii]
MQAGLLKLVAKIEASGRRRSAWLVAFETKLTRQAREGGREEEASKEVEVGWAWSAWEGRVIRLSLVTWVAIK